MHLLEFSKELDSQNYTLRMQQIQTIQMLIRVLLMQIEKIIN